jgi:hypothetical protein
MALWTAQPHNLGRTAHGAQHVEQCLYHYYKWRSYACSEVGGALVMATHCDLQLSRSDKPGAANQREEQASCNRYYWSHCSTKARRVVAEPRAVEAAPANIHCDSR